MFFFFVGKVFCKCSVVLNVEFAKRILSIQCVCVCLLYAKHSALLPFNESNVFFSRKVSVECSFLNFHLILITSNRRVSSIMFSKG